LQEREYNTWYAKNAILYGIFRRKTRYGQLLAAGIFFCQFSGVYGGSRGVLTGASY
jgi:hypothetical protein